jgi:DNA adenine methylase
VALMPRHRNYVEPYAGGLSVLLARDPNDRQLWWKDTSDQRGVNEVVNDINGRLMNFWRVLRDEGAFVRFRRAVETAPLSRAEWEAAHRHEYGKDSVADAVAFFIDARQSRSGLMKGFTPLTRNRTRRGMNGNVSEWLSAVDSLPDIHERLRRVVIENLEARDLIRQWDDPATLFYCDPPYLHETRTARSAYAFEMKEHHHRWLLDVLEECRGKVMLSGYPSQLYDTRLTSWNRHTFNLANHAAGGKKKGRETEVLWCNF